MSKLKKYLLDEYQLNNLKYPTIALLSQLKTVNESTDLRENANKNDNPVDMQICDRCGEKYNVLVETVNMTECVHHSGKLFIRRNGELREKVYSCCSKIYNETSNTCEDLLGCTKSPHVFKEDDHNLLHKRIPFTALSSEMNEGHYRLVAIDCEMSYTTQGLELTRVTVLNSNGDTLIDELVKPNNPIVDLNTKFSGITSLESAKHTLDTIKLKLSEMINSETILVGHGLENDLNALRICHDRVIDTSVCFPHPRGLPYKYSLKRLASGVLGKEIQTGCHDSKEDAATCLELLQFKITNVF